MKILFNDIFMFNFMINPYVINFGNYLI